VISVISSVSGSGVSGSDRGRYRQLRLAVCAAEDILALVSKLQGQGVRARVLPHHGTQGPGPAGQCSAGWGGGLFVWLLSAHKVNAYE
jgi:hypothetical protein